MPHPRPMSKRAAPPPLLTTTTILVVSYCFFLSSYTVVEVLFLCILLPTDLPNYLPHPYTHTTYIPTPSEHIFYITAPSCLRLISNRISQRGKLTTTPQSQTSTQMPRRSLPR